MPLWFTLGIISSVEGIWLNVPLTRRLDISHNYFATARVIIYAAARFRQADSSLVEINNVKSMSPAVSSGEERGLLS